MSESLVDLHIHQDLAYYHRCRPYQSLIIPIRGWVV
jgi:hypothetical protein